MGRLWWCVLFCCEWHQLRSPLTCYREPVPVDFRFWILDFRLVLVKLVCDRAPTPETQFLPIFLVTVRKTGRNRVDPPTISFLETLVGCAGKPAPPTKLNLNAEQLSTFL